MSWSLHLGDDSPVDGCTYNLTPMFALSGVIDGTTRELDGLYGREIAGKAEAAVVRAVRYPQAFQALNPDNGWGDYDGFLEVLLRLWRSAVQHPSDKATWSG